MTRVAQVGQHVFYRFNRNPAPMRMLARAEEVSPEQTEAPVYASAEDVRQAEAAPSLGGEVRLTSAVVAPGAKVSLEAMGGPLEPPTEPASAPAMAQTSGIKTSAAKTPGAKPPETAAKPQAGLKTAVAAPVAAPKAAAPKTAAPKPAVRDEKPAEAKAA